MAHKLLKGTELARATFQRFKYLKETHHNTFLVKARKFDDFYAGDNHWDPKTKADLQAQNRPALTVNLTFSTINAIVGEQLTNRAEITYRPSRDNATDEVASALTKVSRQIDDNNNFEYLETEVFEDGLITSRGYYDVRMDFEDNEFGEVRIVKKNPRNVLPDGDADSYDPKDWRDVIDTYWMSIDEIENLYGAKAAKRIGVKRVDQEEDNFGIDSINRQSFSRQEGIWSAFDTTIRYGSAIPGPQFLGDESLRFIPTIRIVDRQYFIHTDQEHFFFKETGDLRPIPESWDRERIVEFLDTMRNQTQIDITEKKIRRVRWTVSADDEILFDAWSPYNTFTIVPFFPHFRYGRTIGAVENILDPQEMLNKTLSQELHVVNTSANSGWTVEEDSLVNLTTDELKQTGAKTGLVVEYKKGSQPPQKITPNQIPTGLDRLSAKADNYLKTVSTITKSVLGQDREDVAAKAIEAKQARTSINLAKIMDNLDRTRKMIAKKKLDLVQQFYTDERVIQIAGKSPARPEVETIVVNEVTPEGVVVNDLTLGEYDVTVLHTPAKDAYQDTQFDEAVRLKELGVGLPDEVLVENSHLDRRSEIIEDIRQRQSDPIAQRKETAEVQEIEAKALLRQAEAQETVAKAEQTKFKAAQELNKLRGSGGISVDPEQQILDKKLEIMEREHQHKMQLLEMEFKERRAMEAERISRELTLRELNAREGNISKNN
jgi:hypothetical protein